MLKLQVTVTKKGVHSYWMHVLARHLFHNFAILPLSLRLFLTVSQHFSQRQRVVPRLPIWATIAVYIFLTSTAWTRRVRLPQITNNILLKYTLQILSAWTVLWGPSPCRVNFSADVILTLAALLVLCLLLVHTPSLV